VLDQVIDAASNAQKARATGQSSLFDLMGSSTTADATNPMATVPFPLIRETREDQRELLTWEKELLGMYVSDHPVVQALRDVDLTDVTPLATINDELVGQSLTFAGMLSNTKIVTTKKGDAMFVGNFEDVTSSIEFVAFPKSYEKFKSLLHDDAVIRIIGKLDRRNDGMQLMIDKVEPIVHNDTPSTPPVATPTTVLSPPAAPQTTPTHTTPPSQRGASMPDSPAEPRKTNNGNDVIKTTARPAVPATTKAAPPPPVDTPHGPNHVIRLYFPWFDDTDSAVQLMNEIYALTEQFRTDSDGDGILMIHLPIDQRNVVLRMRGTLRDPINLVDMLRHKVSPDAVHLESA
jgi:DNA polymerase-3 subunit alpha